MAIYDMRDNSSNQMLQMMMQDSARKDEQKARAGEMDAQKVQAFRNAVFGVINSAMASGKYNPEEAMKMAMAIAKTHPEEFQAALNFDPQGYEGLLSPGDRSTKMMDESIEQQLQRALRGEPANPELVPGMNPYGGQQAQPQQAPTEMGLGGPGGNPLQTGPSLTEGLPQGGAPNPYSELPPQAQPPAPQQGQGMHPALGSRFMSLSGANPSSGVQASSVAGLSQGRDAGVQAQNIDSGAEMSAAQQEQTRLEGIRTADNTRATNSAIARDAQAIEQSKVMTDRIREQIKQENHNADESYITRQTAKIAMETASRSLDELDREERELRKQHVTDLAGVTEGVGVDRSVWTLGMNQADSTSKDRRKIMQGRVKQFEANIDRIKKQREEYMKMITNYSLVAGVTPGQKPKENPLDAFGSSDPDFLP
jgi:hypothetical protein